MNEERKAVTCRVNTKALKSLQILARKLKKPLNSYDDSDGELPES